MMNGWEDHDILDALSDVDLQEEEETEYETDSEK